MKIISETRSVHYFVNYVVITNIFSTIFTYQFQIYVDKYEFHVLYKT